MGLISSVYKKLLGARWDWTHDGDPVKPKKSSFGVPKKFPKKSRQKRSTKPQQLTARAVRRAAEREQILNELRKKAIDEGRDPESITATDVRATLAVRHVIANGGTAAEIDRVIRSHEVRNIKQSKWDKRFSYHLDQMCKMLVNYPELKDKLEVTYKGYRKFAIMHHAPMVLSFENWRRVVEEKFSESVRNANQQEPSNEEQQKEKDNGHQEGQ